MAKPDSSKCGANELLDNVQNKAEDIKNLLTEQYSLGADASSLSSLIKDKISPLDAAITDVTPKLPASPNISLQGGIKDFLSGFNASTTKGLSAAKSKLALLKKDFGSELEEKGFSLNDLLSKAGAASGVNIDANVLSAGIAKDSAAATSFLSGSGEDSLTGELSSALGISTSTASNLTGALTGGGTTSLTSLTGELTPLKNSATGANLTICEIAAGQGGFTIPNMEIAAANSGTGVTEEEREVRSSTGLTIIAVKDEYKKIVSVQGKREGSPFFTNIQGYKISSTNSGIIELPSYKEGEKNWAEVKVIYIVSLIKEKSIEITQADTNETKEKITAVTTNTNALDTKQSFDLSNLLSKVKSKGILGLATEKEKQGLADGIAALNSPTEKTKFQAALDKQNAFINGTGPNSMTGQFTSALNGPVDSTGKQSTIKVTNPKDASTVTIEKVTKVNPVTKKVETVEVKKTTRAQVSSSGFTNRRVEITESFWFESLPKASKLYQNGIIDDWVLLSEPITPAKGIKLKHRPALITDMLGRQYNPDGQSWVEWVYRLGESGNNTRGVYLEASDTVTFFSGNFDFDVAACSSQAIVVTYEYFEKIDPSVKVS